MADAVVETSPARPQRLRPRLFHLVMGGATVASIVALVAVGVGHVGTRPPAAPRHAPELDRQYATPDPRAPEIGKHPADPRRETRGPSPRAVLRAPSSDGQPDKLATAQHDVHSESVNHQESTTNVNDSTNVSINRVDVTSTNRQVSTSSSVNVENNIVQVEKSGSGTNSVRVSSSVKVSKSERFHNSSP
jgi:hypothetical protein